MIDPQTIQFSLYLIIKLKFSYNKGNILFFQNHLQRFIDKLLFLRYIFIEIRHIWCKI
jgi:hypothetical protein